MFPTYQYWSFPRSIRRVLRSSQSRIVWQTPAISPRGVHFPTSFSLCACSPHHTVSVPVDIWNSPSFPPQSSKNTGKSLQYTGWQCSCTWRSPSRNYWPRTSSGWRPWFPTRCSCRFPWCRPPSDRGASWCRWRRRAGDRRPVRLPSRSNSSGSAWSPPASDCPLFPRCRYSRGHLEPGNLQRTSGISGDGTNYENIEFSMLRGEYKWN